jgi:hypothetical protein
LLLAFSVASPDARAAERVIFCAARAGACAAARPLGKTGDGWWSAIDDRALAGNEPVPRILYFSMAAYNEAVAGLTEKEKAQAVLKRSKESTSLSSDLLTQLYTDFFDLAIAGGADRALLAVALDGAMMLAGGADRYGEAADGYRAEAEALDDLETGRGRQGERFFPPADAKRVYFIPGQKVAGGFDGELPELQAFAWHGGAISTMRPEEAASVKGQRPKLLYYSADLFQADRAALTEAQLDRRLRARLRGVPAREQATLAAKLAFEHAVSVRQYTVTFRRRAPGSASRWDEAVRADTENLRLLLAAARHGDVDPKTARARLRADVALADLALRANPEADPNRPAIERATAVVARLPPEN